MKIKNIFIESQEDIKKLKNIKNKELKHFNFIIYFNSKFFDQIFTDIERLYKIKYKNIFILFISNFEKIIHRNKIYNLYRKYFKKKFIYFLDCSFLKNILNQRNFSLFIESIFNNQFKIFFDYESLYLEFENKIKIKIENFSTVTLFIKNKIYQDTFLPLKFKSLAYRFLNNRKIKIIYNYDSNFNNLKKTNFLEYKIIKDFFEELFFSSKNLLTSDEKKIVLEKLKNECFYLNIYNFYPDYFFYLKSKKILFDKKFFYRLYQKNDLYLLTFFSNFNDIILFKKDIYNYRLIENLNIGPIERLFADLFMQINNIYLKNDLKSLVRKKDLNYSLLNFEDNLLKIFKYFIKAKKIDLNLFWIFFKYSSTKITFNSISIDFYKKLKKAIL